MKKTHVKTPTILQMEAAECGAAALGIILGFHGRFESLEKLREECGVSRDGSSALNIVKAARRYGMTASGAEVEELDELKELEFPFIVFWEFNHFVVVEGICGNKFYINDPSTGPRVVHRDEFDKSFTGILLIFETTPKFHRGGKVSSVLSGLKNRLSGSMGTLMFVFLASLASVIPGIMIPGFSKIFIDNILIHHMQTWLIPLLIGIAFTALMRGLLTWLQETYLLRLQIKLALTSSAKFLWHVLSLPITFFQQRYAGDVSERIAANDRLAGLLSGGLSGNAVSLISIIFYAIVMALLDWQLTLVGISVALINFTLLYAISRKIADISRQFLQDQGRLTGLEMNGIQIMETLKATGSERDFFKRWSGNHAKIINSQQKIMRYNQVLLIFPTLLSGLMTAVILGLGSWQIMQGILTVGTLVAFQSLIISFSAPLGSLLGFGNQIQRIRGDIARLDDVLQHPLDPRISQKQETSSMDKKLQGKIAIRDVTFGYSRMDPPFIDQFTASIMPGSHVAVVGKTGSGKSTLSKLISGLYPQWSGEILLDDKPLLEISRKTLANSLALVDQDIFLFEGTIADNLSLWNSEITESQMQTALQLACIEDVVASRGGLGCLVDEAGANFSGGQRQRMEIARALVQQPTILILDEATSSVDPIVEKQIFDNLKQLNCTTIIITHRLSAIRDCDEIYVLDHGSIIEKGKHDQLISREGHYKKLFTQE